MNSWPRLLLLGLVGQTLAVSVPLNRLSPFNVANYAALGDSFASGPSAGDPWPNDNTGCRRFTQAYGPQITRDNAIQGPKPMNFEFIACSGSRTQHIVSSGQADTDSSGGSKPTTPQAEQLRGVNPDLVTITIGGNDVGFVNLLDRCVYRFYDPSCKGCTPSVFFDDCTNDCNAAIQDLSNAIDSQDLATSFQNVINSIFQYAPNTQLYWVGYPRFWNDTTTECNTVSFKAFCINNSVLPLVQARRTSMNQMTDKLNMKIQGVINASSFRSRVTWVDPNPFFNGHRFCEAGVQEPSYRNPNIWFYPFEYTTGGTLDFDGTAVPSGNCSTLLHNGGDEGDYYACELANAALNGTTVDLNDEPYNTQGDTTLLSSGSSGALPAFLARIFHPTINGMTGIEQAIVGAYSALPRPETASASSSVIVPPPVSTSPPRPASPTPMPKYVPGICSFHLNESQTCEAESQNLYATIQLLDNNKAVIGGTDDTANSGKGPNINSGFALDSELPLTLTATGENEGDYVQFAYGGTLWRSGTASGKAKCSTGGWSNDNGCLGESPAVTAVRQMDCSFPC